MCKADQPGRARLPNYECVFATSATYPDLPCARPISPPSRGPALSLPPACKRNVGIFNPASRWVMTRRGTNGSARGSALLRDRFKIILGVVNMAEPFGSLYHWSGIVKATEDMLRSPLCQ
jgi:hypothetical protein